MLVEIPDLEVILNIILAFLVGLGAMYIFYKARPFMSRTRGASNNDDIPSHDVRLEYYERQLIDMKIRLDAIEIQGVEQKTDDPNLELKQFLEKLVKNEAPEVQVEEAGQPEIVPKIISEKPVSFATHTTYTDHTNPTDYVLHLITNKNMTSRDIQITLKRSREHTSRLMKKLFEDGLVERNTESKPYTYSITEKGKARVEEIQTAPTTA